MSKIRDFICIFLRARQDNAKGRTAIDLGLILERPAMFFKNVRNPKFHLHSEARPVMTIRAADAKEVGVGEPR